MARIGAVIPVYKGDREMLGKIYMVCLVVESLKTLAPEDINIQALSALEELIRVGFTSKAYAPAENRSLDEQGLTCFQRFQRFGDPHDLDQAITSWQQAVDLTPENHTNVPGYLCNLGMALLVRFERVGSLADMESGILRIRRAVDLTLDGHPDKAMYHGNLGNGLQKRFERYGSLADMEDAIIQMRKAVDLTPGGHSSKPSYLNNLGGALEMRFDRYGSPADLEEAIVHKQMAVDLIPDDHPYKPGCHNNLGIGLAKRFDRYDSLADLEEAIVQGRKAVNLTPNGHPAKPVRLSNLGNALEKRFDRHGSMADLEETIVQTRKAVELTSDNSPAKATYLNNLGAALAKRFSRQDSLADLEEAIVQKRKAIDLTPDGHPYKARYLNSLGNTLQIRFDRHGLLADLEGAIAQQQRAIKLTPDGHPDKVLYINNLANALEMRFNRHGSLADLEGLVAQTRKAVDLTPDGHPRKAMYLTNFGVALSTRFSQHGSQADLEEAIVQMRKATSLTPDDHPDKASYLNNLGNVLQNRFGRQGLMADLEDAIVQEQRAVDLTPDGHPKKPAYLTSLGNALQSRFNRQGSPKDLEDAIAQARKAVDLSPDGHPRKALYLNNLGNTSEMRFLRNGALLDLEDLILRRQKAVNLMPKGHRDGTVYLNNLGRALMMRFERFGDQSDLQGALSAAKEAAQSSVASSKLRLQGALSWADCCRLGSTSSLPAYECAVRLLPRMAWLGLAVDDQYYLLASAGSVSRDAVAEAIAEHEYVTAIEWAEQGRSIVWQNLLNLRTSLEELQGKYPELAMRLQEISLRLERPTEIPNSSDGSNLSDTASNQMTLATERDRLIDEIRSKSDFENFMQPKSLKELAPAAQEGPVVFMNLGKHRCDALVLLVDDNSAPHVMPIPLERITLQKAELLSKNLAGLLSSAGVRERDSRKYRPSGGSKDNNAVFKEILKTLWLDYVQPVVDALEYQVNVASPPRLWWCTTGPLAFLPLHAAGLYDTKELGHKLSDYVVSSYTPTLTALLDKLTPTSSDDVKILGVAVSNTPGAPLPCTEEEVRNLQRIVPNLPVVSLMNEKATQKRVLEALETSNWAHLACHGEQVGGKPMESGLILHDGKLSLSKIVKARLPNADFAFLSACQTAVGDGGVPEESAHLAAGMLFAGYRGVVATMWSIQDDIAPRVAEDFYRYLFRHGQPKRAEAGYALHRAVRSLQEAGVPFTSWVPFIHIGR